MDLVDEYKRTFVGVGEEWQEVGRLAQRRSAGHLDRGAQLIGEDGGKRGLAEARRSVKEHVRQRLLELLAGLEDDNQPLDHRLLTDYLAQPTRTECRVALAFFVVVAALHHCFAGHGLGPWLGRKRLMSLLVDLHEHFFD